MCIRDSHKIKTLLKILIILIVLLLFFFTLNLDFQDYIDGFGRLKGLVVGLSLIHISNFQRNYFQQILNIN